MGRGVSAKPAWPTVGDRLATREEVEQRLADADVYFAQPSRSCALHYCEKCGSPLEAAVPCSLCREVYQKRAVPIREMLVAGGPR